MKKEQKAKRTPEPERPPPEPAPPHVRLYPGTWSPLEGVSVVRREGAARAADIFRPRVKYEVLIQVGRHVERLPLRDSG